MSYMYLTYILCINYIYYYQTQPMQTHYCSIIHFLTICAKRGARESTLNMVMEKQLKSASLIMKTE